MALIAFLHFSTLAELADAVQTASSLIAASGVRPEEAYHQNSKIEYELRVVDEKLTDGSRTINFFIIDPAIAGAGRAL